MDSVRVNNLTCEFCQKEFSKVFNKKRHLQKIHDVESKHVERAEREQHIMCSLCPNDNREKFFSYKNLNKHLTTLHNVNIKESVFNFRSLEEFEIWRSKENREVNYACARTYKHANGDKLIDYYCNRSDYKGFKSVCEKRNMKIGGSIRIQGTCPSRMVVKISKNGIIVVTLIEPHVGHADELQTNQLIKCEQSDSDHSDDLYVDEPTARKSLYQDDFTNFIQENSNKQHHNTSISFEERREIALEEICSFGRSLDENSFENFMAEFRKFRNNSVTQQDAEHISKKRKIKKEMFN